MARRGIAGVIFDVDGTLVDTTYLHTVTWWQALSTYGHDIPMHMIHKSVGMGADRLLDHLLGEERDHTDDDRVTDAHAVLYSAFWARLRPLPGAAHLLRECSAAGKKVVLATAASGGELAALRAAIDADDVIDAYATADDVETGKPAPDVVATALERGRLNPRRAVFVGDTVWDVAAAGALDIPCVGLTCGGTGPTELRDAGAIEVHASPAALLAALDESLIARR